MRDIINENTPLPGDASEVTKIESIPSMGEELGHLEDQTQNFAQIMQAKEAEAAKASARTPTISPFDLAQVGAKPIASPNMQTLMDQTNLAHKTFSTIQDQLSTQNLKLKPSQRYLVKNKLSDVNTHLRAANAKMGIPPLEPSEEPSPSKASGPIAQYLSYVTDGMNQLSAAKKQLGEISSRGPNALSPAEFMLLQLKFNKAQQELDFTTTLLAKSLEGLKTVMNVQI